MAEINTNQVSSLKSTLYSMVNNAGYAYKGNAVQSSNIKAANLNVQFAEPKQADLIHTAKEINKKMEHIGFTKQATIRLIEKIDKEEQS